MTDLFTLPELASFLQRDLDTSTATLAREIATGLIIDEIGPIFSTTSTITVPVDCDGVIAIPTQQPVTAITSVTMSGAGVGYVWEQPYPRLRLTSYAWPQVSPNGSVWPTATVVFTHGWATAPTALKAVALSVAARAYDNPRGMRTEGIDDYNGTRAGSDDDLAGVTLTQAELRRLSRFTPGAYMTRA